MCSSLLVFSLAESSYLLFKPYNKALVSIFIMPIISVFEMGFPAGLDSKASACNAGDPGSISCLQNAMDGGAWWATVHGVTKSRT